MNISQLNSRLEKLEPQKGGQFDGVSDEELQNSFENLTRLLMTSTGEGDPQVGYEQFKTQAEGDLPDTFEAFMADWRTDYTVQLNRYFEEMGKVAEND